MLWPDAAGGRGLDRAVHNRVRPDVRLGIPVGVAVRTGPREVPRKCKVVWGEGFILGNAPLGSSPFAMTEICRGTLAYRTGHMATVTESLTPWSLTWTVYDCHLCWGSMRREGLHKGIHLSSIRESHISRHAIRFFLFVTLWVLFM